jgi:hypothetical protein
MLCDTVLQQIDNSEGGQDRLARLLAIDRAARLTCERLLYTYVEGDAQLRIFGRKSLGSALRLSQSMAQSYDGLLQSFGVPVADDGHAADVANVVVRLLYFCNIEILLRMLRYKKRNAEHWRAIHNTYLFARNRGLHTREVQVTAPGASVTAERQYIQILLLDAASGGQLTPSETLAAQLAFVDWSHGLHLQHDRTQGLAVDLRVAEGPTRKDIGRHECVLHLDTAPVTAMIEKEVAELRRAKPPDDERIRGARHARIELLGKLELVLAPHPRRIERRGERASAGSTVQVLAGLPHVVNALRHAAPRRPEERPHEAPLDESTIAAFGGSTRVGSGTGLYAIPSIAQRLEVWQLRDRSVSGCRIRGKTADLNRVIPGSLIALRERDVAPWSLAVVRRLRRLMVDYVEMGVEYISHRPRFVKLVMEDGFDPAALPLRGLEPRCIAALYLPTGEEHPKSSTRTLLLPPGEYRRGRQITLLSSNAMHVLRLTEAIERQLEFTWTSFAIEQKLEAVRVPVFSIAK